MALLGHPGYWADFWQQTALISPELWLTVAMCAVILVPFIRRESSGLPLAAAILGLLAALVAAACTLIFPDKAGASHFGFIFSNMLAIDPFSQFFKVLLTLFTLLIIVQWLVVRETRLHVYDVPDFLCLLLGATTGMALMASANNLLMIFVATETASLPSFALAGFRKSTRLGSESSLKYVVFGTAASAISVYGMSLVYGATGSLNLQEIANAALIHHMNPLLAVGLIAMFAGFAFKLSAVPMHFWCPDVFQGAPLEVTTFLSVASKAAALCMTLRVLDAFGAAGAAGDGVFGGLAVGIGVLGVVTATWGNLVAFHQTNIKRLLAYSSIAQAGYMLMGASAMALCRDAESTRMVGGALLFYVLVYMFMNLGAFTVAGLVTEQTGSEELSAYASLFRRAPVLAIALTLFLLSLFGMPGLGGFIGKFYLMQAMQGLGAAKFAMVAALVINTLISFYLYVRPVYFMLFVEHPSDRPLATPRGAALALLFVCGVMLLWTGIFPGMLTERTADMGVLARHQAGSAVAETADSRPALAPPEAVIVPLAANVR